MRFLKALLIIFTALLIILTITYSARVSIINNVANAQLTPLQAKITCLDISLSSNMDIVINKLCLQSPKVDIEISNTTLQWQYAPYTEITSIDVSLVEIKGTDHWFTHSVTPVQGNNQRSLDNSNISQLISATLRPYFEEVINVQLPININIADISYSPFTVSNNHNTRYAAEVSIVDNVFDLSLSDDQRATFLTASLSNNKKLSLTLSAQLAQLKSFISRHQLPITTELQQVITTLNIAGTLDTLVVYQDSNLTIDNKITSFEVNVNDPIDHNEVVNVSGDLHFQSQLNLTESNNEDLIITFAKKNEISFTPNQTQLFALLAEHDVSPTIVSILQDNPITHLVITPEANSTLTIANSKINLDHIDINAQGDTRSHKIQLENIAYSQGSTDKNIDKNNSLIKETPYALTIESFIIDGQLYLADIEKFTTEPVTFHLTGSLNKIGQEARLNLNDPSAFIINNIASLKQQNNEQSKISNTTVVKNTVKIFSIKKLVTSLSGLITVPVASDPILNLNVLNQASHITIPKTLQLASLKLLSQIKGGFDNIAVNTSAQADNVDLGNITITGPMLSPKIEIAATKLQLTDLLSLNIQLPIKVELVDGLLDYHISGQPKDLSNIENIPFDVSVAVMSVSGEVDGIWLQDLNWQQNLSLLSNKITTKPTTLENLTIALIDTPTPVSNISLNVNWAFNDIFTLAASKLKADTLGGSIYIPTIKWPIEQGHSVNVQLTNVDLEQVLALDKKQGIVVTGNISGEIPVTFDGEKYTIENGELHNITNGVIQVSDNPAVIELKASNSQLQLAFDALQNLHYHQLSSAVSMADDGYMLLETVIKGRNPDIDNDVNLNLNLSYDLPGLLESLVITQRFEDQIIQGLQKKRE